MQVTGLLHDLPGITGLIHDTSNRLLLSALLGFLLLTSAQVSGAESEPVGINTLKAVYLFNFARFVEWPADSQDGDVNKRYFCFYGADHLARTFAEITVGAWLGERQVMVRRLARLTDADQCDLLYTNDSVPPVGGPIEGLLTVGIGPSFVRNGGVIGLVQKDQHLRFKVNRGAAVAAKLTISSHLLSLVLVSGAEVDDE